MLADRKYPLTLAALFGLYVVAGKLGLSLAFVHARASPVWPPTGIALAALLTLGYRVWPAIFAGAFVVNISTAGSVATSLGIAAGNTLEGLLAAYLVDRYANGTRAFDRSQDVFKFAGFAALLSTTVSSTIGVASLALGGYAAWADFDQIWLTWWLGDASGALIVAPLLVLWVRDWRSHLSRRRLLEVAALWCTTTLIGLAVFGEGLAKFGLMALPLTFLCTHPSSGPRSASGSARRRCSSPSCRASRSGKRCVASGPSRAPRRTRRFCCCRSSWARCPSWSSRLARSRRSAGAPSRSTRSFSCARRPRGPKRKPPTGPRTSSWRCWATSFATRSRPSSARSVSSIVSGNRTT